MPRGSAAVTGAIASLDELYRLHSDEAWRVAYSITRNRDDASDAVADAFAGVLKAVTGDRTDDIERLRAYLMVATRNAAYDVVRRTGRLVPFEAPGLDRPSAAAGPSERLAAGDDGATVVEALAGLPPRWRAVLWLTEVEGMAPREAADLLGTTPNNVAQIASRARSRLRQRYVQSHVRNHASGDCAWTVDHLGAVTTGKLTEQQARQVQEHLAGCEDCRARLAELDDLGLSLRRAAIPLAIVIRRSRVPGWLRPFSHPWGRSRHLSITGANPTAVGTVAQLVDRAASPVVQGIAAAVTAGLLAVGVGSVAVRQHAPPAGPVRATEVAAPPSPTPTLQAVPADLEPTTTSTTTTTVALIAEPPAVTPKIVVPPAAFTPRAPLTGAQHSVVARAVGPAVAVSDAPGAPAGRSLANPLPSGSPLVLLVTQDRGHWLQVLLPVRPNGSTGWVRRDQVSLSAHDFLIVVELGAHRLTAYQGKEVLLSEPIAVGTNDAPTPDGLYYTTELIQPVDARGAYDPGGPYGPYAYPLSGFSEVLFDFAGGDGRFGIHGTNDPSALGTDVSHGCIRMSNAGIGALARILPAGVPVDILP